MRSVLGSFVCAARRALSKTVARPQAIMQSHDGGPMRTPFLPLLALLLIAPLARADSDDLSGGVLLVHAPPSLTYTASASWCDSTHLEDCEDQVTSIPTDSSKTVVWFILSAWSEEKSFTAVEFGLGDFDPESFLFSESGLCLDHAMALYHGDWPGPNTGVAIASNDDAWTGQLVPIAWFAGYNYAEGDTIAITENPATEHAGWVSGESRTTYDAECLGALGLGADGLLCCPSGDGFAPGDTVSEARYPAERDLLEVMFCPQSRVRLRQGRLVDLEGDALRGLDRALGGDLRYEWSPFAPLQEAVIDSLQSEAAEQATSPLYDLNNMYRLRLLSTCNPWVLSSALEALPGIIYARPTPLPSPPPFPPDYVPNQDYLEPSDAPYAGIDAEYAWTCPGGDGSSVTVCDIEYSWNYDHLDLSKAPGSQLFDGSYWTGYGPLWCDEDPWHDNNHGTAALGMLASDKNAWGTTGICNDADILTACQNVVDINGARYHLGTVIVLVASTLDPGDVILMETQWDYTGSDGYVPSEWYGRTLPEAQGSNPVYEAIRFAVARGIHVVEAGGNGSIDTDEMQWSDDSGAIIVGAGRVGLNGLARGMWTSYGMRYNLQGWEERIFTCGYGDYYSAEGTNLYYTSDFGGTSGASAMAAGVVADCIGFWQANVDASPPSPRFLRALLITTGEPQRHTLALPGHIGPLPDLRSAFDAMEEHDIIVTPDGAGEYPTIQAAIDAAVDGDVIGLTDGTFEGAGNRDIDFLGKAITVRSISGRPEDCVIDCGGGALNLHRAFHFCHNEGPASLVQGILIRGGFQQQLSPVPDDYGHGGAVLVGTVENWDSAASPRFVNCEFRDNLSEFDGGAVSSLGRYCSPSFEDCRFEANGSGGQGGAIFGDGVSLSHCVIEDCGARQGGGVFCRMRSVVSECTIVGNHAVYQGGGICCGSVSAFPCSLSMTNCTLAENDANSGAGLFVASAQGSDVRIEDSIVAFGIDGEAVGGPGQCDVWLVCSDIYGNEGGDWVGCIGAQLGSAGNIQEDPMFCDLEGRDLRLDHSSPCLRLEHPDCGIYMGAWPVGCPASMIPDQGPERGEGRWSVAVSVENPVRGPVTLRYWVPAALASERLEFGIFDVSGRLVRRLFGGECSEGAHAVIWDCRDTAGRACNSGVYYCRVGPGGPKSVKPLVLMR